MKTNFQMMRELDGFTPANKGILSGKEIAHIKSTLHIEEMDVLALRNLRDFVAMFYGRKMDRLEEMDATRQIIDMMDIVSGITCVIDTQLYKLGAEV